MCSALFGRHFPDKRAELHTTAGLSKGGGGRGGQRRGAGKGMKKSITRYKFNILSVFLLIAVLSLVYQIITGLYGLISYKQRMRESEQLLREKMSLVESLEAKIQQFNPRGNEPAPEVSPGGDDRLDNLPEVE